MSNFASLMPTENLSSLALIGAEAAFLAGTVLRRGFGTSFSVRTKKGVQDLVTEYDQLAEQEILAFITKHCPSSHFLAEESGKVGETSAQTLWIIDPLDGTLNFAHGLPVFAVSIAAFQNDQVVAGAIYQPMTGELFVTERGKGAFLNGKRLKVSSAKQLEQGFVAVGFPYNIAEDPANCIEHFSDLLHLGVAIRRLGAAALDLAYTAAGRFDAFFEVSLAPWDCAAGILMVEEAGGIITEWSGSSFDLFSYRSFLGSNGQMHEALLDLLRN